MIFPRKIWNTFIPYLKNTADISLVFDLKGFSMNELPKRKPIRIEDYDYSTPGAYFITVCTANREKIFWSDRRGELCSPANVPLSDIGIIVHNEIKKLNSVYDAVRVDKYCIMPDHIHMILTIYADENCRRNCGGMRICQCLPLLPFLQAAHRTGPYPICCGKQNLSDIKNTA